MFTWPREPTSSSGAVRSPPLSAVAGSCVRVRSSSMSKTGGSQALVIGLGNPIMADDGLGIAALKRLGESWTLPGSVHLVDGGTWGMNLLPLIEDATELLLLDAIDRGRPAGELNVLEREEIPRVLGMKLSPHQIDLREVLALAELRSALP